MGDTNFSQGLLMEELWRVIQQLQEENNNFRNAFERLQVALNLIILPTTHTTPTTSSTKEPRVSLLYKFNGI